MEEVIAPIIASAIVLAGVIAVIATMISEKKKERQKREWEETTKCAVCKGPSLGKLFCHNCLNRVKVIKGELPHSKIKDFDKTHKFKQELINRIIYSKTQYERQYNSVRLMAVSQILKDKYFESDEINKTAAFLEEFSEINYISNDDFIKKYADPSIQIKDDTEEEEENIPRQDNFSHQEQEPIQNKEPPQETINQTVSLNNKSTPFKDGCLGVFGGGCGCVTFIIVGIIVIAVIIVTALGR